MFLYTLFVTMLLPAQSHLAFADGFLGEGCWGGGGSERHARSTMSSVDANAKALRWFAALECRFGLVGG